MSLLAVGDDEMLQRRHVESGEYVLELPVSHRCDRSRILQYVLYLLPLEPHVDGKRNRTAFHRAQIRGHKADTIRQVQRDPVAGLDVEGL